MFMRGSKKFFQKGSSFDYVFFLVDEGRKDSNTTISGSTSETPFNWRLTGGPMVVQH